VTHQRLLAMVPTWWCSTKIQALVQVGSVQLPQRNRYSQVCQADGSSKMYLLSEHLTETLLNMVLSEQANYSVTCQEKEDLHGLGTPTASYGLGQCTRLPITVFWLKLPVPARYVSLLCLELRQNSGNSDIKCQNFKVAVYVTVPNSCNYASA
jgi:hypothetical protein